MEQAVADLLPYMEAEKAAGGDRAGRGQDPARDRERRRHDIGENIVGVVLTCNNYR